MAKATGTSAAANSYPNSYLFKGYPNSCPNSYLFKGYPNSYPNSYPISYPISYRNRYSRIRGTQR
jgi:hypothetical protein